MSNMDPEPHLAAAGCRLRGIRIPLAFGLDDTFNSLCLGFQPTSGAVKEAYLEHSSWRKLSRKTCIATHWHYLHEGIVMRAAEHSTCTIQQVDREKSNGRFGGFVDIRQISQHIG